jgi:hypothetical protein
MLALFIDNYKDPDYRQWNSNIRKKIDICYKHQVNYGNMLLMVLVSYC